MNTQRTTTQRPSLLAAVALRVAQPCPQDRQEVGLAGTTGSGMANRLYLLPATNDDPDDPPPSSPAVALPHSRDAPG